MNNMPVRSVSDIENIEKKSNINELIPFDNTYDAIKATAKRLPNNTALSFFLTGDDYKKPFNISYSTLIKKITQTANFLNSLALKDDDVVAFLLPNLPETHYIMWGAEAKCQVFAINPLLEPEQIKDLINNAGAKVVITMNPMPQMDLWEKIESIFTKLEKTEHVIGIDIAHYVRGGKGLAAKTIQIAKGLRRNVPSNIKYYNFTRVLPSFDDSNLAFSRSFNDDTISSLFCTGGTTGLPKIARRTHKNELSNATSVLTVVNEILSEGKTILGGLPLFHVNGALVTGLGPFMVGAKVVMATPQGYRGANLFPNFWDIIEHFRVNAFSGVPTVYSALMNFSIKGKDISSLELCICGAAPMPVETFKAFEKMTGVKILEGYGLTEGTCVSSLTPPNCDRKIGSIGMRIPYQKMICAEIDGNNQLVRKCDVDEIGALLIRGPNVFLGYQYTHQNKDLWITDVNGEKWLNTGDLAREDCDGYFWLTGRKKELIVRGGHNIEPKLIEEAMCQHPEISLAAAVGRPDEHAGEVPVCYVQSSNNNLNIEDLNAFAKQHIPERAAIPKEIYVLPELPVTAVGKVFKPELERQQITEVASNVIKASLPGSSFTVDVKQDPKYGLLAIINISKGSETEKASIEKALGGFTFKYRVSTT